jgi:hypothetical protein
MLDPKQLEELRATPCLSYDALMGIVSWRPSRGLSSSHPQGHARNSSQKLKDVPVVQGEDDSISSCKYMLACLVHKNCKDISMRPLDLPPGHTRVEAREDSCKTLEGGREEARSKCPPDPFTEVKHQLKQARVVGIKAQAVQIAIQSIQAKMQTLQENVDVYIKMNGQKGYNKMLAGLVSRMTWMGKEEV